MPRSNTDKTYTAWGGVDHIEGCEVLEGCRKGDTESMEVHLKMLSKFNGGPIHCECMKSDDNQN